MKLSTLFSLAPDWEQVRQWPAQPDRVLTFQQEGDAQIGWRGDVTAATVDEVWDRTSVLLNTRAHTDVEAAIDLKQVRFLDSAGIGFMLRVRRMARQHGLTVRFVNPSEPVRRVVRLAKLEDYLLGEAA
jgi:anti-anti-sigma factor